jgi:hypothetical protein
VRTSFYCTVRDGNRTGFLLGPFGSLSQAEGSVPLARRLAERVDPWSAFYRFGVASLPAKVPVRVRFDADTVATFGKQTVRAYHHA